MALTVLAAVLASRPAWSQAESAAPADQPVAVEGTTGAPVVEAVPAEEEKAAEPAAEAAVAATPPAEGSSSAEAGAEVGASPDIALEAAAPAAKPAVWRNSLFVYENAMSAYSFDKSAELTYNPYYVMSYRFAPRFYLYKGLSMRLDWTLEQELTNSDSTTKKHELFWSDLSVDFVWGAAATIPKADIAFTPKIGFTLPASKASQARTLYLAIAPGFDFLKTFDVLGGITLQWAFRYTKYFNKYTGSVSEDPSIECPGVQASCPYYTLGPRNPSHQISNSFLLEVRPTMALYIDLSIAIYNRILYPVSDTSVEVSGGTYDVDAWGGNTNHSGLIRYTFEIGYDVAPFMTIALGADTYNTMLAPNSKYYAPFFNRNTNLYLDFVLYPEVIVSNLAKKGKAGKLEKQFY